MPPSRFATRFKLADAWCRFPGALNNAKVESFTARRHMRKALSAWRTLSSSYMKRTEGDQLRDLLRRKGGRNIEKQITRGWTEAGFHADNESKSFLVRVEPSVVSRMSIIWQSWKGLMMSGREARIEAGRRSRMLNKERIRSAFLAWSNSTHSILRRSSFAAGRSSSSTVLRDRSMMMMSFLNKMAATG